MQEQITSFCQVLNKEAHKKMRLLFSFYSKIRMFQSDLIGMTGMAFFMDRMNVMPANHQCQSTE